ncbi:MAG TPA: hypothetical protein VH985_07490 [Candidatus Binatia bacterium]
MPAKSEDRTVFKLLNFHNLKPQSQVKFDRIGTAVKVHPRNALFLKIDKIVFDQSPADPRAAMSFLDVDMEMGRVEIHDRWLSATGEGALRPFIQTKRAPRKFASAGRGMIST